MYQTCSFRATISQKSTYLIQHYAISGFGWTYLYVMIITLSHSNNIVKFSVAKVEMS